MKNLKNYLLGLRYKWDWINEGRKDAVKGLESENRFEKMTDELTRRGHLPWLVRLYRGTIIEDVQRKIDFKILAISENENGTNNFWIRIQIKSSRTGVLEFHRRNPTVQVYVIAMDRSMNSAALRKTLDTIYLTELEKVRARQK